MLGECARSARDAQFPRVLCIEEDIAFEVENGMCTRRALAVRLRRLDTDESQMLCDTHGRDACAPPASPSTKRRAH